MITNESVKEYIAKMYGNELFQELEPVYQERLIFSAHELLKDNFKEKLLTDRIVSLQTLFMLEGEDEEYAKLKRHGIKSYKVKDVSVTFSGSNISPEILSILTPKSSIGKVARLI